MKPSVQARLGAMAAVALLGLPASTGRASADDIPPPRPVDSSPYEAQTGLPASLEIGAAEVIVRLAPDARSRRRGVAVKGSRLPALESAEGPGCDSPWYRVFDRGWVCGDDAPPSNREPAGERLPRMKPGDLTPWPYAFIREESLEYRPGAGGLQEVRELSLGFGFGVAAWTQVQGRRFLRTVSGHLVPAEAAGVSGRVSRYEGIAIGEGDPWPVGWVNRREASAWREPSRRRAHRIGAVQRYDQFGVLETRGQGKQRFYRFDDGAWLWSGDVRVARPAERPESVGPEERWIDIDLAQQILTAYEGDTPVYATLVSTGRGGQSRTVKGEFRIWAKIAAIAMDNTDEELEEEPGNAPEEAGDAGVPKERHLYSLHDVPWTQFFHESYALHGVYWHDRFGNRRSHGCVNLAPRDARWLFDWTRPALPDGWWAIHAVPEDLPTLVRVR